MNVVKLSDLAAQKLIPDSIKEGRLAVEFSISRLRLYATTRIWGICSFWAVFLLLSIASFGVALGFIFQYPSSPSYALYSIVGLVSLFCCLFSVKMGAWFQVRKSFFVKSPYDVVLPAELDDLMAQLRTGELRAYTSGGYGKAPVTAIQTVDGILLHDRLSPETFANRYAPLLLSAKKKTWALFWLSFRRAITRPIYVEIPPEAAEPGMLEATLDNAPEVSLDEPLGEPHWSATLSPEKRSAFVAEFTRLGKWTGENERKIAIAWTGIFEFDGPRKILPTGESKTPLVEAAVRRLEEALKAGEIESLWLSESARPDPSEILRKMLGDGKDRYATMAREARATVLADKGNTTITY